jgi:hypothetical protein
MVLAGPLKGLNVTNDERTNEHCHANVIILIITHACGQVGRACSKMLNSGVSCSNAKCAGVWLGILKPTL